VTGVKFKLINTEKILIMVIIFMRYDFNLTRCGIMFCKRSDPVHIQCYVKRKGVHIMATVCDVSKYILKKAGRMTTMKLQKLVYYSQAWSLVWDEEPLFDEPIEAWANGPVVRSLYDAHRGQFKVGTSDFVGRGKCSNLSKKQKETIDGVLKYYGDKSAQWLIDLTHLEDPWRNARGNCGRGESCDSVISHDAMMEYYSGL